MKPQSRREFMKFLGATAIASSLPLRIFSSIAHAKELPKKAMQFWRKAQGLAIGKKDELSLHPSLKANVVVKWGDLINPAGDTFGYNNDYLACFPLPGKKDEILLWANHETPEPLFVSGYQKGSKKTAEQVEKEMYSVGGSIVHLRRKNENWSLVSNSPWGRRLSGKTKIPFAGGVSIKGEKFAIGTFANCAGGVTPWNTVLTCEENYDMFYGETKYIAPNKTEYLSERSKFGWEKFFARPPEHYGWVVEVNPFTGEAKKHTSLGRFAHEGATVVTAKNGRVVVYSGDDAQGEFVYKFIAAEKNSLEKGILYVANLSTGEWLALDWGKNKLLQEKFASQLDVLIYAREAARILGATPLDRPEDIERDPRTGDILITLTNNIPKGNFFGSILKIKEKNADPLSLKFSSETFLMGGEETGLACPDNLCFDRQGRLWVTTDMPDPAMHKEPYAELGNNALLCLDLHGANAGRIQRMATAPFDAELTGPTFSPQGETLFLSVQHPGALTKDLSAPTSNWPEGGKNLPKPAVVAISGKFIK